jgi:hypothetical protein
VEYAVTDVLAIVLLDDRNRNHPRAEPLELGRLLDFLKALLKLLGNELGGHLDGKFAADRGKGLDLNGKFHSGLFLWEPVGLEKEKVP